MAWSIRSDGVRTGTPVMPSGWALNDILILVTEVQNTETVTTPSGYTELATHSPQTATDTKLQVFWKRATGSETAPTVAGHSDHVLVRFFAVRGATTSGSPFRNTAGSTAATSTTADFDAVAADAEDFCFLILGHGRDNSSTPFTAVPTTTNIAAESRIDMEGATANGNGGGHYIITGVATATADVDASGTLVTTLPTTKISASMIGDSTNDTDISRVNLVAVVDTRGNNDLAASRANLVTVVNTRGDNDLAVSRAHLVVVIDTNVYARHRWHVNVN